MAITSGPTREKAWRARIAGHHLAARLAAGDDPRDHVDDVSHDVVVPNAGKIRKSRDSPITILAIAGNWTPLIITAARDRSMGAELGEGPVEGIGYVFDCFQVRSDRGPRNGAEKFFLGLKVEVEGGF